MPWKWLAASLATMCVAVGSTSAFGQQSRCDATNVACDACPCGHCKEGVGVRIPSLQVLFVDKLSAVGDRLEHSYRTTASACDPLPRILHSNHRFPKLRDTSSSPTCGAEPSCGVEPSCGAEASCGVEAVSAAPLAASLRRTRSVVSSRNPGSARTTQRVQSPSTSGKISDTSPSPVAESKQAPTQPTKTDLSAPVSVPFSVPVSLPNSEPPKLLPTPLSDLPQTPSVPRVDPPKEFVPPTSKAAETESLPRVEAVPSTPKNVEPLPDILVDPFLEDVSKARPVAPRGVALSGWRAASSHANSLRTGESVPFNSLRDATPSKESDSDMPRIHVNEPKRLTLGQKQATTPPSPPHPKRIVVMQSLAEESAK